MQNHLSPGEIRGNKQVKELTFSNDTGAVNLFTVTGDVEVDLLAICKTNVASAGGCNGEVGISGSTGSIIATTDITTIAANEIWHDASPDATIEAGSVFSSNIISNGADIILTLSAQADSGAITFYVYWTPLSVGANIVAA
jgi:hypothetical protein